MPGPDGERPAMLLFEVDLENHSRAGLIGLDYLRLGEIHYDLFADLEYLLSATESAQLKHSVVRKTLHALPFLRLCSSQWRNDIGLEMELFFSSLRQSIGAMPILGYMYFESIAEFLMRFADCDAAARDRDRGEFFNVAYKRLIYGLRPSYRQNFRLHDFDPSIDEVCGFIANSGYIKDFSAEQCRRFVASKLLSFINTLLIPDAACVDVATNATWSFERMVQCFKPLIGHMIHRELRAFGRYPDFYHYFDQLKALHVWNYWNHMDVVVPFNGVFPKGEAGLNPANPDLKTRAFECRTYSREGDTFAEITEEARVRPVPKLVDLKHTSLRNKH